MIKATLIDSMGNDLTTVNAARVSFGKVSEGEAIEFDLLHHDPEVIKASVAAYKAEGWTITSDLDNWKIVIKRPTQKDTKLISYLAKHKHISPFGHAFASFHVKAPIFVARQLVKHKFLRWNEISRRYVDDEPEFYVPDVWRGKSEDKKQGSSGVVDLDSIDQDGRPYEGHFGEGTLGDYVCDNQKDSIRLYNTMIKQGVAPEQARMILPQGVYTEWYWSGSLDAFANMCRLRLKEDTQYETRLVAQQISVIMADLFPVSWEALVGEDT
jgi:thymidylate synthase (FAD)